MTKMRKITVELPARELDAALKTTGAGLDDTLRIVLENYIRKAKAAVEASASNSVIPDGR